MKKIDKISICIFVVLCGLCLNRYLYLHHFGAIEAIEIFQFPFVGRYGFYFFYFCLGGGYFGITTHWLRYFHIVKQNASKQKVNIYQCVTIFWLGLMLMSILF